MDRHDLWDYWTGDVRAFQEIPRRQRILAMALATPVAVAIVVFVFGHPLVDTVGAVSVGLVLVGAGAVYLRHHGMADEPIGRVLRWFVDLRTPTRREWVAIAAVVVLSGFSNAVVDIGAGLLWGTGASGHSGGATATGGEIPTWALVGLVGFIVVIGPFMEELVFRNGLQKVATDWVHPWVAIVGVSVVFTLFHVPSYGGLGQPVASLGPPLAAVGTSSVLYGYAYHRTGNVVVPMVAHGAHNAVALLTLIM